MKAGAADYVVKASLSPEGIGRSLLYAVSLGNAPEAAKQAQAELRATAELRLATTAADIGTWDLNLAAGAMVWDDRCRMILGIPPNAETNSALFLSAVHPDDRERVQRVRQYALDPDGDGHFDVECRVIDQDGTIRWIDARGRALFKEGGEARHATRFIGTTLDITERKRAEESLREDARLIETLHNIGTSLASELDVNRIVQAVTDEGTKVVGARFGVFCQFVAGDNGTPWVRYTLSGSARESPLEVSAQDSPDSRDEWPTAVVRVDDIRTEPDRLTLPPQLGWGEGQLPTASCLAVPVISHGSERLATLFLGHPEPSMFTPRHERLVTGLAGWAAVAMDNARLYEAEQRARSFAERANRAKAEFLSSMSHDLRAPLNAVGGYAQLVLDGIYGPTTDKQRDGMQRILRAQQHLLAIIRDILDFARIEAGHARFDIADVEVNELLAGVNEMIEPQMTAKEARYACPPGPADVSLRTDRERVVQILPTFYTNALRIHRQGFRQSGLDG
jgi:PAS domain S-box-containing protein